MNTQAAVKKVFFKRKLKRDVNASTAEMILLEAERIIAEEGIDGLRLKNVADAIGVKLPALYAHYNGFHDILLSISIRLYEKLAEHYHYKPEYPVEGQLLAGVREIAEFFIRHPAYARIELRDLERPGGLRAVNVALGDVPEEEDVTSDMVRRLDAMLKRGADEGIFRPITVQHFLDVMRGVMLMKVANMKELSKENNENRKLTEEEECIVEDIIDCIKRLLQP